MAEDYLKLILRTMKSRCAGYQRLEDEADGRRIDHYFHIMDGSLIVSKEVADADEIAYKLQKTRWKGVPEKIAIWVNEETRVEYLIRKKRIECAERKWCAYSHYIDNEKLGKKKLSQKEIREFLKEAYGVLIGGKEKT